MGDGRDTSFLVGSSTDVSIGVFTGAPRVIRHWHCESDVEARGSMLQPVVDGREEGKYALVTDDANVNDP